MAGSFNTLASACDTWSTIAGGPGTPDSAMVGTSGNMLDRVGLPTPSARTLPPFKCGTADGPSANITSTCPPSRSCMAGALPRYGMC
ncbi:hypothetical protein G6F63_016655 [Rhizopus arrhizus]|nr:hypothetical protein G6F63_016655 [Rhizopus arrhizus]